MLDLPEREIDRWRLYWGEEPWGPYRDNMHAAMIVTELLKPNLKEGVVLPLSTYMFEHQEDRKERAVEKFMATIDALSRRKN